MSDILAAAKQHYSNLIDGELKSLDVAEWQVNGAPARIYYRQYMTVEEKGELVALYNEGKHYEMMVMSLIFSARDADGNKQFKKANKFELMKFVSAEVVEDIFSRMALFSVEDDGLAEKK